MGKGHPTLSRHGAGQGGVGRLCIVAPVAGHGFLLLSAWWLGMRVWAVLVRGQVGG